MCTHKNTVFFIKHISSRYSTDTCRETLLSTGNLVPDSICVTQTIEVTKSNFSVFANSIFNYQIRTSDIIQIFLEASFPFRMQMMQSHRRLATFLSLFFLLHAYQLKKGGAWSHRIKINILLSFYIQPVKQLSSRVPVQSKQFIKFLSFVLNPCRLLSVLHNGQILWCGGKSDPVSRQQAHQQS